MGWVMGAMTQCYHVLLSDFQTFAERKHRKKESTADIAAPQKHQ